MQECKPISINISALRSREGGAGKGRTGVGQGKGGHAQEDEEIDWALGLFARH